jgi:hypothetical protein
MVALSCRSIWPDGTFKQKELLIDPDNQIVWFSISKMVYKALNLFMLINKNGLRKILKKSFKHKTLKTYAEKIYN